MVVVVMGAKAPCGSGGEEVVQLDGCTREGARPSVQTTVRYGAEGDLQGSFQSLPGAELAYHGLRLVGGKVLEATIREVQ